MSEALNYSSYLRLDELLSQQQPRSQGERGPEHDELLFIVIHQVYELWFKLVLREMRQTLDHPDHHTGWRVAASRPGVELVEARAPVGVAQVQGAAARRIGPQGRGRLGDAEVEHLDEVVLGAVAVVAPANAFSMIEICWLALRLLLPVAGAPLAGRAITSHLISVKFMAMGDNGIRVNRHMQTSDPHVYAVGDVADPVTTINGTTPSGTMAPLSDVSVMIDTIQDDGNLVVYSADGVLLGEFGEEVDGGAEVGEVVIPGERDLIQTGSGDLDELHGVVLASVVGVAAHDVVCRCSASSGATDSTSRKSEASSTARGWLSVTTTLPNRPVARMRSIESPGRMPWVAMASIATAPASR